MLAGAVPRDVAYPQAAAPPIHAAAFKEKSVALLLESLPGVFQVFGIGHICAGRWVLGLLIMFTFWVTLAVNLALLLIGVGLVSWPMTWLFTVVVSSISVALAVGKHNRALELRLGRI